MKRRNLLVGVIVLLFVILNGCATYKAEKNIVIESFHKGKDFYSMGKYGEARNHFRETIAENPESPLAEPAIYYFGRCYMQEKEYKKALNIYENLIKKYQSGFWVKMAKIDVEEIKQGNN